MVDFTPAIQLMRFGLLSSAGPAILPLRAKATMSLLASSTPTVIARNLMVTGIPMISFWFFAPDLAPVWKIVGFGRYGIVGGTTASKVQSIIGIVGERSLFAVLQSAAMGRYGTPIIAGTVKAAGFLTACLSAGLAVLSKMKP